MNDEKSVGEIIRALRGEQSLREFAEKCNMSHTAIDTLEKGVDFRTNKPCQVKANTLEKISKACNYPIDGFFGNPNNQNRLRLIRNMLGLSITTMSEKLNMPIKKYLLWENIGLEITKSDFDTMSGVLGYDARYIAGCPFVLTHPISSLGKSYIEDYNNGDDMIKERIKYHKCVPIYTDETLYKQNSTRSQQMTRKNIIKAPVYGNVAAGIPIEAIEDIEDYEELDADTYPHGDYVALKIHGHSMEPRMYEGDVVIVRLQEDVNSGDTAIVIVNGDEATCKKIKKTPEGIFLISTNPVYEPMFYTNEEIIQKPLRILGKVVELRAKY